MQLPENKKILYYTYDLVGQQHQNKEKLFKDTNYILLIPTIYKIFLLHNIIFVLNCLIHFKSRTEPLTLHLILMSCVLFLEQFQTISVSNKTAFRLL